MRRSLILSSSSISTPPPPRPTPFPYTTLFRSLHPRKRPVAPSHMPVGVGALSDQVEDRHHHPIGDCVPVDRKSTRLNSSHLGISYAVFCLKKKTLDNHRRSI